MNNTDQFNTDFLFPTPTYLTGAGTIFNLSGNFYEYNDSSTEDEADCKAIRNDFNIIGNDLKRAVSSIGEKNK